MALKFLVLGFVLSAGVASANDIFLSYGESVRLGDSTVYCGIPSNGRRCPEVFSSDPNLQNCSRQVVGTQCVDKTGRNGHCQQPGGGSDDWCVCM